MDTSYSLNAYKSHDLNISMKTSSGDVINLDFANKQSLALSSEKNDSSSSSSLSFSSMQSFQYSIDTNGIDAQDKKEINAFMKIAQPFIDDFLQELDQDAPKTPVTKLAHEVADIFSPMKNKDENTKNYVKTNIVDMFDQSLKKLDTPKGIEKVFEDAQKLLEKTLDSFDEINKLLYA